MRLSTEATQIALISIFLGLIGFISSISDIFTNFGIIGGGASVLLTFLLLFMIYRTLRPVLLKNKRNVTLLEAIEVNGLVDIENRNDQQHPLAPQDFFSSAKDEIVLTATSAFRTFDQNLDALQEALDNGISVYILIINPNSKATTILSKRENVDMKHMINETINIIRKNNLHNHPAFRIRFADTLPTFTAIMIDGDVLQTGKKPRDELAQIRIQPLIPHYSQNAGVVFQFRKTKSQNYLGTFDYFAEEVRRQWREEGQERPDLFQ
jgi:hypothetical protein